MSAVILTCNFIARIVQRPYSLLIASGVIGCVVILLLAALLLWQCTVRRRALRQIRNILASSDTVNGNHTEDPRRPMRDTSSANQARDNIPSRAADAGALFSANTANGAGIVESTFTRFEYFFHRQVRFPLRTDSELHETGRGRAEEAISQEEWERLVSERNRLRQELQRRRDESNEEIGTTILPSYQDAIRSDMSFGRILRATM